jgi:hypothetical protein
VGPADSENVVDGAKKAVVPVNPDDIESSDVAVVQEMVQPKTPEEAAWMSFTRSLYASAEFRFVR